MGDARFQDGDEGPLRLIAQEAGDVQVLSALLQDAVLPVADMRYDRKRRRLVALVNRFRWEDREAAASAGRPYERVRSLLTIEDVLAARTSGIDLAARGLVLSILSLDWHPGADGTGKLVLTLAGGGALALEVEALDARLDDVTKPYIAPSGHTPNHGA
ncbi:MAG: DUF2948 family protein [Paracoccaceae bacterium]